MKIVRVENGRVAEIIPEGARPLNKYYPDWFAGQCVEAPEEVQCGWVYDEESGTFAPYVAPEPPPTPSDDLTQRVTELEDVVDALMEGL